MKTLEVIHLRLAGDSPKALVDLIRQSVETEQRPIEVRIYGHSRLETDVVVHLHREGVMLPPRTSDLGVRLASLLRNYGMVEHSVWNQL